MERYWWKNTESEQILNRGYLLQGETVEGAIDRVCTAAAKNLFRPELKEGFKELIERGWMSLSSPIWANMGTERGLPISCFNVHIPDRIEDITHKLGEVIMQTKIGGGTSGYFGAMRERGSAVKDNGKSSGAVSFMKLFDTTMDTISQGGVRRGAFAAYLDIDHPDIEEFMQIKSIGNPIQNLFYAVCVPDYWMNDMIEGDLEKRKIWAKVLENRQQKGLPYIFFSDNVNRNKPQVYKDKGMMINSSNLCSEIALPSSIDESFICCLSSLNLEAYDEWKDALVNAGAGSLTLVKSKKEETGDRKQTKEHITYEYTRVTKDDEGEFITLAGCKRGNSPISFTDLEVEDQFVKTTARIHLFAGNGLGTYRSWNGGFCSRKSHSIEFDDETLPDKVDIGFNTTRDKEGAVVRAYEILLCSPLHGAAMRLATRLATLAATLVATLAATPAPWAAPRAEAASSCFL